MTAKPVITQINNIERKTDINPLFHINPILDHAFLEITNLYHQIKFIPFDMFLSQINHQKYSRDSN